jgi:hypothetical protein
MVGKLLYVSHDRFLIHVDVVQIVYCPELMVKVKRSAKTFPTTDGNTDTPKSPLDEAPVAMHVLYFFLCCRNEHVVFKNSESIDKKLLAFCSTSIKKSSNRFGKAYS